MDKHTRNETRNALRHTLSQEYGLTRESVRDEMHVMVSEAVKKAVAAMLDDYRFKKLIREQIDLILRANWGAAGTSIETIILREAQAGMRDWIKANVSVIGKASE